MDEFKAQKKHSIFGWWNDIIGEYIKKKNNCFVNPWLNFSFVFCFFLVLAIIQNMNEHFLLARMNCRLSRKKECMSPLLLSSSLLLTTISNKQKRKNTEIGSTDVYLYQIIFDPNRCWNFQSSSLHIFFPWCL